MRGSPIRLDRCDRGSDIEDECSRSNSACSQDFAVLDSHRASFGSSTKTAKHANARRTVTEPSSNDIQRQPARLIGLACSISQAQIGPPTIKEIGTASMTVASAAA